MSDAPQRLDHLRRSATFAGGFALAGAVSLVVAAFYLAFADTTDREFLTTLISAGVVALGLVLVGGCSFLRILIDVALKLEANTFRIYDTVRDLHDYHRAGRDRLETIAENVQLSDTVRSVMHRDRERTALRLAISEELVRGDIEAAYALVEQLEARHGYKNEAARLRREVDLSREQLSGTKVQEAVERVKSLLASQDWDPARREMDRVLAQFPNHPEVRDLPRLFTVRRGEHKRRLLKEWDDAVQRNAVDKGIEILRELDQYLTKNEAAALEESARGVFRTKLHNMGLQFSLAVTEHNWRDALALGRQIMEEFPNSRMASEVRERIGILTKRAEQMPDEEDESATPAVATPAVAVSKA
jgi:hypothetical protein